MSEYETILLRPANPSDELVLYNWANSDLVRSVSLSNSKFSWESHQKWFRNYFDNPKSKIFIGLNSSEEPIGQIRFDKVDDFNAEVHVYTKPDLIGQGIGTKIIRLGTENYLEDTAVIFIHALILESNFASIRAFQKAGYQFKSEVWVRKRKFLKLTRSKAQK